MRGHMVSPAIALRNIRTLVEGSQAISSERSQLILLRSVEEVARKGWSGATKRAIEDAANVVTFARDAQRP